MSGKYPAFQKLINNTLGPNYANANANHNPNANGAAYGPISRAPSMPANYNPEQRVSIFDRTPSEIEFEESLEIIIEDDRKGNDAVEKWLPSYFVPSWIKHRDAERKKIPFSVLIMSKEKNELRDLDELWDDYNLVLDKATNKPANNPRGYIVALLDGKQDMVTLVMNKCGTGIEAYRNVIKCLLLYNLKRIHKIVEWEDTLNAPGIPIYDSSPNNIFLRYEKEFVNGGEVDYQFKIAEVTPEGIVTFIDDKFKDMFQRYSFLGECVVFDITNPDEYEKIN